MEFSHIGKGHLDGGRSGRYPWGSGENPHQRVEGTEKKKYKVVRGYKNFKTDDLEKLLGELKKEEYKRQLIMDIEKLDAKLHNRKLEEKDKGFAESFRKGFRGELGTSTKRAVTKGVETALSGLVAKALSKVGQKYLIDALDKKLSVPVKPIADAAKAANK